MELARHCELCNHQQVDFVKGTTCALTSRKPNFSRTCSRIQLDKKFEERLEKINVQYELVRMQRGLAILYLIAFLVISMLVFFLAYTLGKTAASFGAFSAVIIIIYGIGGLLFLMAFKPLATYLRDIEVAKANKETIDKVLELYAINYIFDIKIGKKIHGKQNYEAQLEIKK